MYVVAEGKHRGHFSEWPAVAEVGAGVERRGGIAGAGHAASHGCEAARTGRGGGTQAESVGEKKKRTTGEESGRLGGGIEEAFGGGGHGRRGLNGSIYGSRHAEN